MTWEYPELTSYQYAGNEPITNVDLDGLEPLGSVASGFVEGGHRALGEVVVQGVRHIAPTAAKVGLSAANMASIAVKAVDIATDFIPVISGSKDIYNGVKSGNLWQAGLGVLSIAADLFTLSGSSLARGAIKTAVREGAEILAKDVAEQVIKEETEQIVTKSLRQRAVRQAWKEEKALVKETGEGTRQWSEKETVELLEKGKVKGYQGHHINNVKHHPNLVGNPNNIKFVTPKEHLKLHNGNFLNKSTGTLINRTLN